jgi:hypothetical protein
LTRAGSISTSPLDIALCDAARDVKFEVVRTVRKHPVMTKSFPFRPMRNARRPDRFLLRSIQTSGNLVRTCITRFVAFASRRS